MKIVDLTGQQFGRLTVIERARKIGRKSAWRCRCECGGERVTTGIRLTRGESTSCGCKKVETLLAHHNDGQPAAEVVTYSGAHRRVRRERGAAKYLGCADCGAPAGEWSYDRTDPDETADEKGRPFSMKPEHYSPRCVPCHRAFDRQEVPA